jgi:hypothetical protein
MLGCLLFGTDMENKENMKSQFFNLECFNLARLDPFLYPN